MARMTFTAANTPYGSDDPSDDVDRLVFEGPRVDSTETNSTYTGARALFYAAGHTEATGRVDLTPEEVIAIRDWFNTLIAYAETI